MAMSNDELARLIALYTAQITANAHAGAPQAAAAPHASWQTRLSAMMPLATAAAAGVAGVADGASWCAGGAGRGCARCGTAASHGCPVPALRRATRPAARGARSGCACAHAR
jgi:hypothetical protein